MNFWRLVQRSFGFHLRANFGTLAGAAIGSAVLVGALMVGDSVRHTLASQALARLGKIDLSLGTGERLFREQLADDLAQGYSAISPSPASPLFSAALQLPGTVARDDGSARANQVQVLGVTAGFWRLGPGNFSPPVLGRGEVLINERLAAQLKAKAGDVILCRVSPPSQLSREAPVSPQESSSLALRLTVRAVLGHEQWGDFSLQANQIPPFTAFVDRPWLQEQLKIGPRANLIVARAILAPATSALEKSWQLADAQLELRAFPERQFTELRSSRIFLDDATSRAAGQVPHEPQEILTYFVNELRLGERSTPYSMVSALEPIDFGVPLQTNEIIVSDWLAEDLQAKTGDEIVLKYFVVGPMRSLEEKTNAFQVRAVIDSAKVPAAKELMPDFPGLTTAENCRDWDAGFPIDTSRIRPKDEKYWDDFRGTPKAYIALAAGQQLWTNRFGSLTAVRYRAGGGTNDFHALDGELRRRLAPSTAGLVFLPVREQALAASREGMDFGGLFLGFSFFLIVAALLLIALLFQLNLERRSTEAGTLLALGWEARQVRHLFLAEGLFVAVAGSLVGAFAGVAYGKLMILGLATIWRSAVGSAPLVFQLRPLSVVIGVLTGIILATLVIAAGVRRLAKRPARVLLAANGVEPWSEQRPPTTVARYFVFAGVALALSVGLMGWSTTQENVAPLFFGAGSLLLIAGLFACAAVFRRLAQAAARPEYRFDFVSLAMRNVVRKPRRSLLTVGLLACGSFLIVAVGAHRLDANLRAEHRNSGTGGFALLGETALPVFQDLNRASGLEFYGLDQKSLEGLGVVPLRVRDGDDASCLNLNRAQQPRILGVDSERLAQRNAFHFAKVWSAVEKTPGWRALEVVLPDGAIPAIADAASIQWALGKKLGDAMEILDEQGHPVKIRFVGAIANSVLQGNVLISERHFVALFPSETGYRRFLMEAPANRAQEYAGRLTRALQNEGLELVPARDRLAQFNAVQNTYLSTFQVLGGLGLLLGSAGLAIVVLRNVWERRGELGLLKAVGFAVERLRRLILAEHGALLVLGIGVGLVAGLLAVAPGLFRAGPDRNYRALLLVLAGILVNGAIWTWIATRRAVKDELMTSLRTDEIR